MRFIISFISILFVTACVTQPEPESKKVDVGVEGWTTVGENIWGTINGFTYSKLTPGKSYLVSPKKYTNYRLELEFNPDAKVNSGVFVNCATNQEIGSKSCYEANISDNHKKPEFRTGSIVRHALPSQKVDTIGKWNTMVYVVNNGKAVLSINGVQTAETTTDQHPAGYIGLQRFKEGRIIFRNIKITEL